MYKTISSLEKFNNIKSENQAVLFYFSHDNCNVCKVLKPKIYQLLQNNFSNIKFRYIDVKKTPDIAAQNNVFTVPTILIYLEGKEFIRKNRNIGLEELRSIIERPYSLMF